MNRQFRCATVVGGGGAVGTMLARSLVSSGAGRVTVVDTRVPAGTTGLDAVQADIRQPSVQLRKLIADSDLVILAVPEEVAIHAAALLGPLLGPNSLLVDTLSVKSRYAGALAGVTTGAELLGINPMFAPSLGLGGRSLVAVAYEPGELTERYLASLAAQGCDIVRLGTDEHDRACASMQALTHAAILTFGMALRASGFDVAANERILPPPHRTLLALLARVVNAEPEVYREIQQANPYASEHRTELSNACRHFDAIATASGDAQSFERLFDDLRSIFVGASSDYGALCARLFEAGTPARR